MSSLKLMLNIGRAQLLGIVAQVIAAAPIIAMSIYLSHTIGIAAVADFALLIGISSIAFTLGMLGLRTRMVLDRFGSFSELDYLSLRVLASAAMALAILGAGFSLDSALPLILAVLFLRLGDAALDLVLGIDQIRLSSRENLYGYLHGSSVKLALIALCYPIVEVASNTSPFEAFEITCLAYSVYAWGLLISRFHSSKLMDLAGSFVRLPALAKGAAVFCVAQFICSLLTSAPRLVLPGVADRGIAGAAAAALSVSTLVGMAYFAVWLRWVPKFGLSGMQERLAILFLLELSVVLIAIELILWFVAAPAMALIYNIEPGPQIEMSTRTLMSSAIFFFIMTSANLFKPTRLPWAESAVYLGGLLAMIFSGLLGSGASVPRLILAGAWGMAGVQAVFLVALVVRGARQST